MEKVNTGLKILLRLFFIFVGVSILLGRIQIQEYQAVDYDLVEKMRGLSNSDLEVGIQENPKQTNYRVVLKF